MYGNDIMVKNISEVQSGEYTRRVFNITDTKVVYHVIKMLLLVYDFPSCVV